MKNTVLSFLLTLISILTSFAQSSKTHYLAPLSKPNRVTIASQFLYISTPSLTPVNFIIKQPGGANINGVVSRNTPYSLNLSGSSQYVIDQNEVNVVLSNKGLIIEAEDIVYVSTRCLDSTNQQAGAVVSKGSAALGKLFRIGSFTNTLNSAASYSEDRYTFASILATENNTVINFSDVKAGAVLVNNSAAGNLPSSITLNAGETFAMAVQGPTPANRDCLIGALIKSDKPISVTCGSLYGSNGELGNLDMGFDQIVSQERTGQEYIFVKSTGQDNVEIALIVAHENGTQIFVNGSPTAITTIDAGQYYRLNGSNYNASGNLYVTTNKKVFAYQSVGNGIPPNAQANQEMFFVPPLSCQTPKVIDNIPAIESIGSTSFTGRVTITTLAGSILNFTINNTNYTLAQLATIGVTVVGPTSVTGNTAYQCYSLTGLAGNVSVFSSGELYLAAYGSNVAATFGGYYSGFTFRPDVTFQPVSAVVGNCLPNINLAISSLTGFDVFQWFQNDNPIPGATLSTYTPTTPGFYKVKATLTACNIDLFSDEIPVSNCPINTDNDAANNNIDVDLDNDGITNCTESYGNQDINLTNINNGTLSVGSYSNTFTGVVTNSTIVSPTPVVGSANGNIVMEVLAGKTNFVKYELNFPQPLALAIEYPAIATDLLNSNAEYIINCPINQVLTVLNPNNQILIDTNYDGFYESNVTQYSSFEIRFRLNSATPLAAGTGTFRFLANNTTSISIKQKNLLDNATNKATFRVIATCVAKDTDGDGILDQLDSDSDNDGITDVIEAQGTTIVTLANADTNADGLDNAYGAGQVPVDTDLDGVPNYLDLDSDNDGIYDLTESGSGATDANANGIIDGTNFGTNGLNNALETVLDNGILNYVLVNLDTDVSQNYIDLDSDGDLCNDVIEAGFLDPNSDGILGATPVAVNANGLVTSGVGYTTPNSNYIIGAPISISVQPADKTTCELQGTTFSLTNTTVTSYQWQVSTNGTTWADIVNGGTSPVYSGATSAILSITNVPISINNYKYRVFLNRTGNSCGLYSAEANLKINALPVITTPITILECDTDIDGIAPVNLKSKNGSISLNFLNETFTYFTTPLGASTNDSAVKIPTIEETAYVTSSTTVYARVENTNGCIRVATINVIVSATNIPSTYRLPTYFQCDDLITPATPDDRDGVSLFNFSNATALILATLPAPTTNYTVKYYKNQNDANTQVDALGNSLEITLTDAYRNVGFANSQAIWVRVSSNILNGCYGLGPFINLVVEPKPFVNTVGTNNIIRKCDNDLITTNTFDFDTRAIQSQVLFAQTNMTVSYFDALNNPLPSPLPNPFPSLSQTIKVRVTNNATATTPLRCFYEGTFQFIVDVKPVANPLVNSIIEVCDDENDPADQNGKFKFDTSNIQSEILGSQTGVTVSYSIDGATSVSSLPNPFLVTNTSTVVVTVTNSLNTTCPATRTLVYLVKKTPKINLNLNGQDDQLVCSNIPTFAVTLDAEITDGTPQSDYSYQWFLGGIAISGATTYSIPVNTAGFYTVEVKFLPSATNLLPLLCSKVRSITVTASDIATINDVQIQDLADSNSIVVTATGLGDYVYSINDSYGPYQVSPVFENLEMGTYTLYVKDLNGCGIVTKTIYVLGVPKFFTPNSDGFNDTWNVKGIDPAINSKSVIHIFDRFGKLIKQISPVGSGWDGTFNNQPIPADDYWYSIIFEDTRIAKGHFSLKR